jgi:hypothetical protein
MPDNFSQTLREGSARFADGVTPGPPGLVRARGDQRRRRTVAGSVVISAAVIAGAIGGGLYGFGQPSGTVTPVSPRPVASVTAPAPTTGPTSTPTIRATSTPTGGPTGTVSAPASGSAPASTPSSSYAALAGQWKLKDGGHESLYIFPDGMMGVGDAAPGYYALCEGRVQPPVNGVYAFTDPCGVIAGPGTITVTDGTLTVHFPDLAGGAGSTVAWTPVPAMGVAPSSQTGSAPPLWLVGTWTWSDGGDVNGSFEVASTGAVTWTFTPGPGQTVSGTGTVEPVPGGASRIVTSMGSPRVDAVWPIFHDVDGALSVIGPVGSLTFKLTSSG